MDWTRALRTGLRTGHLLAFGALYGGQVFGVAPERLVPALAATVGTGLVLLLLDAVREPAAFVQLRGLAAFAKLSIVIAVSLSWSLATPLLTLAAVLGAVSSHMPGRYRYYSVFHGRVVGSQHKG
jgi:hypothetical protein